jgi:hypothetical protein
MVFALEDLNVRLETAGVKGEMKGEAQDEIE